MLSGFHAASERVNRIIFHLLGADYDIEEAIKPEFTFPLQANEKLTTLLPALYYLSEKMHRTFDTLEEERVAVLDVMQWVLDQKLLTFYELKNRPEDFFNKLALIAFAGGNSLGTALGVQIILAGGSVMNLAHPKLSETLLPDLESGKKKICFAMTELGHGTNVKAIQTRATYDLETDEFVIDNMAYLTAQKWLIGSAKYADYAVVFADLQLPDKAGVLESKGPHAILVNLRKLDGSLRAGIRITDLGHKMGTNGVANCSMQFDNIRTPRDHLMMREIVELKRVREEGVWRFAYHKLASFPLVRLYSTLKYGRTLIGQTSMAFQKVLLILAEELRRKALPSIIRPNDDMMIKWMSQVFALEFAVNKIHSEMNRKSDTLVTGVKVLSNQYCEKMIDDMLRNYLTLCPAITQNFLRERQNWVVGRTYEGDDAVIPQKVMGDKLIALMGLMQGKDYWTGFHELYKISKIYVSEKLTKKSTLLSIKLLAHSTLFEIIGVLNNKADALPQSDRWSRMQFLITELGLLLTQIEILDIMQDKIEREVNLDSKALLEKLYAVYESRVMLENVRGMTMHLSTLEIPNMPRVDQYNPTDKVYAAQMVKQKAAIAELAPQLTDIMNKFRVSQGGGDMMRFIKERLYQSPKIVHAPHEPIARTFSWQKFEADDETVEEQVLSEVVSQFKIQCRL